MNIAISDLKVALSVIDLSSSESQKLCRGGFLFGNKKVYKQQFIDVSLNAYVDGENNYNNQIVYVNASIS